MQKLGNILNKIEEWFLIIAMAVMSTVVFLQVLFRIFSGSLPWSEELSRYLTIWISAIGASYGFRHGAHIGVDAFKLMFPPKMREVISIISYILVAIICLILVGIGLQLVQTQMQFGQRSPAMRVPMWIAYLALPVGFLLSAFRNVILAWHSVKKIKNNDFEEHPQEMEVQ